MGMVDQASVCVLVCAPVWRVIHHHTDQTKVMGRVWMACVQQSRHLELVGATVDTLKLGGIIVIIIHEASQ